MMLLRLLAFKPVSDKRIEKSDAEALEKKTLAHRAMPSAKKHLPLQADKTACNPANPDWSTLIKQLKLTGLTHTLAHQCALQSYQANHICLCLIDDVSC